MNDQPDKEAQSTAIATKTAPAETVREMLEKIRPQLQAALPKGMLAERLNRVAWTSIQKNPSLAECAPVTLLGAVMQCAQLGLMPDGILGEAYLIPYRNNAKNRMEAQFQIGYKGLRKLINNSGEIATLLPQVAYEGDVFEYNLAEAKITKHERTKETQYGKPTHFYTIVRWKTGAVESWVMTKAEVDHVRDTFSQGYKSAVKFKRDDTPWVQHYEAMALKTVIRRHAKYLPLSSEAQRAFAMDERAEAGLPQDLGTLVSREEKESFRDAEPSEPPLLEPKKKAK